MISEELDQKQKEGFGNRFDSSNAPDEEVELRETLDEEIHQVIFKQALDEAVMNLALNGGEDGHSSNRKDHPLADKEVYNDKDFSGPINVDAGVKDAENQSDNWGKGGGFDAEVYDTGNQSGGWGIDGVFDGNEGLNDKNLSEGVADLLVYMNEQEETKNAGDHGVTNEDAGHSSGGGGWTHGGRSHIYPVRPGAEDCAYYVKTGNCKYGPTCKFNHTPRKKNQGIKEKPKARVQEFEQQGTLECKFYLTPAGCKYGKACKYSHTRERTAVAPVIEFNFLGLPIRLGERDCPYYMRHGSCKYGSSCKFNHPHPTSAATTDPAPNYGNGGSVRFQSSAQSTPSSWSAVSMVLPGNQHIPLSSPDWNGYSQTQVYPTPERSLPTPPAFAVNNPAAEASFSAHHQQHMPIDEYPERPGQPECSFFLKTGDCKFKSNCRFHHPKTGLSNSTSCILSDKGLPLRPDQSVCSFYNRYGICKFGPACKFDHPENWGGSATSGNAGMARNGMEANLS